MLKIVERPKRKASVDFEIATVTPEIARAWLDQNISNRKVKASHVDAMARDMVAGDWKITGDAIRFDVNNLLLDGQHRLLACIKAGVPFTTAVIYGLPSEVKKSIDLGVSRSAADLLSMANIENANHVTAAARWLYTFRSGVVRRNANIKVTVSEYMAVLAKHKALPASVRECRRSHGIPISMVSAIHYIGTHLIGFPDRASAMAEVMRSGSPDYQGDPIHKLRERMMRSRSDSKYGMHRNDVSAYFVHAWNNFAVRKSLEVVKAPSELYIEGLDPKAL